jgi:hypothetical protein
MNAFPYPTGKAPPNETVCVPGESRRISAQYPSATERVVPAGTPNTLPSAAVIRKTCEWTRNCCRSATATPSMVSERSVS